MILLDTDVCIELLRGNENVINHRNLSDNQQIAVSFMTVAELYYGAKKSSKPKENKLIVDEFLLSVAIIHTDYDILELFGPLKDYLEKQGNILADADLFIASTCLTKCQKLVTGNTKHFSRIENLTIDNWIK